MVGIAGETAKDPPSILYCTLKPATDGTFGKLNAALHVFAGAVIVGAVGKITTLTVLLGPHDPLPTVFAAVVPHAAVSTYRAVIV